MSTPDRPDLADRARKLLDDARAAEAAVDSSAAELFRLGGEVARAATRSEAARSGAHVAAERDEVRILATTSQDDQRLLRDVATVVHWIPSDVVPDVVGLGATAVDHITLQLTDDREVVWGSAEQSELKSEVLGTLLQVEASVYDVSAPTYPTTR